jgi:hypothetical protein
MIRPVVAYFLFSFLFISVEIFLNEDRILPEKNRKKLLIIGLASCPGLSPALCILSYAIIAIIFLRLAKKRKDFSGQTRIINHVIVYVQLYLCHTGEFFERGNAEQQK